MSERYENVVQRDICCTNCGKSYWYVKLQERWFCPECKQEVHRDVLKEIERPQQFRTASWGKGKPSFGMGWDKKAHKATAPALGV